MPRYSRTVILEAFQITPDLPAQAEAFQAALDAHAAAVAAHELAVTEPSTDPDAPPVEAEAAPVFAYEGPLPEFVQLGLQRFGFAVPGGIRPEADHALVRIGEQVERAELGDWIVSGSRGTLSIVTDAVFTATYTPVD